jgi:dTDP-4-dehydrorhamnose reductase
MAEKLRVLITGSNGLLGQKLVDAFLLDNQVELLATARGENRHPKKGEIPFESMDITNSDQMDGVIDCFNPNVVIHTAAMTQVDDCEFEKEACVALNIDSVEYLAKKSKQAGFRLVHLSTDFIFDGTKKMYQEEDEPNPLSYYGWSKLEAEKRVLSYADDFAILRTVLVYGQVADMSRSNIILWAYNTLKEGKAAKVVDDQFRTPTLAEDLAQGCILAAKSDAQGVFNIAGKDYIGIYDLVQRIAEMYDLSMDNISKVSSATLSQPAKRPPITGLDIQKARKVLGYEPHSLEDGIKICLGF